MKGMIRKSLLYRAALVHRRAPLWKAAGLIFIHVPKNGGTSLNHAIYGQFMGHFTVQDILRTRPALLKKLPSLALKRNPWARVYSAYRFARKGRDMKDGAQIAYPQKYQSPEFETFERFVFDWLDGRDLSKEDFVFRPQTDFVLQQDGSIGASHIGCLEDPSSYVDFAEAALGRHLDIKHFNQTTDSGSYRQAFTPQMRDIVAHAYAKDLEIFGYDF